MSSNVADAFVLVFTFGMSLKGWKQAGLIGREWAMYREVLKRYGSMVLVTYGDAEDLNTLREVCTPEEAAKVHLVCNERQINIMEYMARLPELVNQKLRDARRVVVKTNQMVGGEAAVRLTEWLRLQGKDVGLIARGGYLWTRFVTHEHGPHSEAADDAGLRERLLCQAADVVVGTTSEMVSDLSWRYGLNPARTRVVPNYVLTDFDPVAASDRDPGLILFAGQLIARKRVDLLVRAIADLPEDTREKARLVVVGEGPEKRTLEQLAMSLGAPVEFLPRMPHHELLALMSRCTIYAQASDLEGQPKTVLEAMASGAVVIVAHTPGLGDVVEHGATGLRLPSDPEAFATAIGELLNDVDWREMLGTAASRVTRARFGIQAILPRELEVHALALAVGTEHVGVQSAKRRAG